MYTKSLLLIAFLFLLITCDSINNRQVDKPKLKADLKVKDFFIPDSTFNFAEYRSTFDPNISEISSSSFYLIGDSGCVIYDQTTSSEGILSTLLAGVPITLFQTSVFKFTNNEIIKTFESTRVMADKKLLSDDLAAKLYPSTRIPTKKLIMPSIGDTIFWDYIDYPESEVLSINFNCYACWTEVNVNDSIRNAIKLVEKMNFRNDTIGEEPLISYYVEGIGLFKSIKQVSDSTFKVAFQLESVSNISEFDNSNFDSIPLNFN